METKEQTWKEEPQRDHLWCLFVYIRHSFTGPRVIFHHSLFSSKQKALAAKSEFFNILTLLAKESKWEYFKILEETLDVGPMNAPDDCFIISNSMSKGD